MSFRQPFRITNMAEHIELNGVRTWYDERGEGEPLVLLHGGFSDSRDFDPNLAALADRFRLLLPDRRGHGRTPDVDGPITAEVMARDTIALLDEVVGGPVRLAGYSAGGTVALLVALHRPDLVERLVLISTAFSADGLIFRPVVGGELPPPVVERYAEVSPDGAGHLQVVVDKVATALGEEPGLTPAQLAGVTARTLVLVGDDDLVALPHTLELYRGLADAELAVVPATSHLLLFEKPELCTALVADFLTHDRGPILMPIGRAS
jgi:pimeloyl-ACP methyl ester carboxylesterase